MTFINIFLCCLEIILFIHSIRWAKTFAFLKPSVSSASSPQKMILFPQTESGGIHLDITSQLECLSPNSPRHNHHFTLKYCSLSQDSPSPLLLRKRWTMLLVHHIPCFLSPSNLISVPSIPCSVRLTNSTTIITKHYKTAMTNEMSLKCPLPYGVTVSVPHWQ